METIKIIGIKDTSFTSQDGKQINGVNYFFTMRDEKVQGLMAGKLFISSDKLESFSLQPELGQEVQVVYNRFGKPDDFVPVQGLGEVPPLPGEKAAKKG